jgi:hypothetical protein
MVSTNLTVNKTDEHGILPVIHRWDCAYKGFEYNARKRRTYNGRGRENFRGVRCVLREDYARELLHTEATRHSGSNGTKLKKGILSLCRTLSPVNSLLQGDLETYNNLGAFWKIDASNVTLMIGNDEIKFNRARFLFMRD